MIRDDRYGCRSLVCDANGIIIAEMVHRCMICAHISESINDARSHYQQTHFESSEQDSPSGSHTNGQEEEEGDDDNSIANDDGDEDTAEDFDQPSSSISNAAAGSNQGMADISMDQDGDSANPRGGFVTCAVCNIVKFYASVQRRYGQFTCMGCAKFFGRFLLKPKRFYCPYLGSCPLDVTPRCKACLLQACTNTYILDDRRKAVAEANRPIKRVAPASQSTTIGNPIRQGNQVRTAIQRRFTQLKKTAVQTAVQSQARTLSGRPVTATSAASSATPALRKQWGCRKCPGCLIEDCGKCNYCLDKPKFGGPNTLKKKCINRRCHALNGGPSSTAKSSLLSPATN